NDWNESGVADAADLFFDGFPRPFYRLFFPASLLSANGYGSVQTPDNFVIVSAPSYTALSAAVNHPVGNTPVAFFRGRPGAKLCIRISVNGADVVVPVGTPIGNLLARYARRPPNAKVALEGVRLTRAMGPAPAVFDTKLKPSTSFDAAAARTVHLG